MDIDTGLWSFLQSHWEWIFGGGGAVGTVITLLKIFLSKPSIQQHQTVTGEGEAYQAGHQLTVHKPESDK